MGKINRDPLPLIKMSSEGRIKSLVELRYGRMLVSPFTFYRGNALLQAHDLAATSSMGLISPICGDSHLMIFGGFATPERNLLFSVNDFDEAHPGPWEWDLKRLVASFVVAARDLRHGDTVEETVCRQVVGAYQQTMLECAEQSAMETWYESISYRDLRQQASKAALEHVERAIEKAEHRTHAELLPKISDRDAHGRLIIRDDLPEIFHLHENTTLLDADDDWLRLADWRALYDAFMRAYGRICGRALARAHAKSSGNAAHISGYIGKSDALADALFKYAQSYAEQNERDFERFQQACRKGRLRARSEADFAADHLP